MNVLICEMVMNYGNYDFIYCKRSANSERIPNSIRKNCKLYEFTDYSQILVVLRLLWNGLADSEHFLKAIASDYPCYDGATRVATFINLQNI